MHNQIDNQSNSFRYLSLGDSFLSQKTNLLLINMMYSMLRRQMEVQSISSFSELESTDYLRVEDNDDDIMHKRIIFTIRFSKCVNTPENAKEIFSKLRSPVVSANGDSPFPFYTCLTSEYHPLIQLEVSAKVLSCWESWVIPYTPKTTGKYTIHLFLFLYNRIHQ